GEQSHRLVVAGMTVPATTFGLICALSATGRDYLSSPSRPAEAGTAGLTATRAPVSTHARWLGEKRGANRPSLISLVTAKRLNTVGGRYSRSLLPKPSVAVSISPTAAVTMPWSFGSTRATSSS